MGKIIQGNKDGFTLVELSMVILIIGFVIAGISIGDSLVAQSRLNGVITDLKNISSGYKTFQLAYNSVPGDMPSATSYWNGSLCAVTPANCNGNGDRKINTEHETLAAMRHLSLSGTLDFGLVPFLDTYDGTTKPVIGSDVPKSRIKAAGYMLYIGQTDQIVPTTSATYLDTLWQDGVNAVFIGAMPDSWGAVLQFGALSPQEAYNIDEKIDDGHIAIINDGSADVPYFFGVNTGKVRTFQQDGPRIGINTSNQCLNAPSGSVTQYNYNVNSSLVSCGLGMAIY